MTKSRPILFSPAMVTAILDGKKSQTRRAITPQPISSKPEAEWYPDAYDGGPEWTVWGKKGSAVDNKCTLPFWKCPYGVVGDSLWVREEHYRFGHWREVPGVKTKTGKQKWAFIPDSDQVLFVMPDKSYLKSRLKDYPEAPAWHKRLARFMPRSCSRITLEITEIRVERLCDISETDSIAEGVSDRDEDGAWTSASEAYAELWDKINGDGSWNKDPFVWCLTFKVVS